MMYEFITICDIIKPTKNTKIKLGIFKIKDIVAKNKKTRIANLFWRLLYLSIIENLLISFAFDKSVNKGNSIPNFMAKKMNDEIDKNIANDPTALIPNKYVDKKVNDIVAIEETPLKASIFIIFSISYFVI